MIPAILAVRAELELPLDQQQFLAMAAQSAEHNKTVFDSFIGEIRETVAKVKAAAD